MIFIEKFIIELDTEEDYRLAEEQMKNHFKNFKMPEGDR